MSRIWVRLRTGDKHVSGVTYFHSVNSAGAVAAVSPTGRRNVTAELWAFRGGRWSRVNTLKLSTDVHGRVLAYLNSARTYTLYRFTIRFAGDTANTGSHVTSTRFEIT